MTSNKKSGNALDDLMLAYTDLSGNSKKPGFKGPPVKDIKREREAPKQVFQHSNKARDWRAFDKSLESVFGCPNVSNSAPVVAQDPVSATVFGDSDEWGDFQHFSSSQSPSVGCRYVDSQSTLICQCFHSYFFSYISRLATFQDESPVHRFKQPQPPPSSTVSDLSGLRLQPPPALHQSRLQPASREDNDEDFGDFTGPSIQTSTLVPPTLTDTAITSKISWNATKPPYEEKLPAMFAEKSPSLSSSDRYSALRDLLGDEIQPSQPPQTNQHLPSFSSSVTSDKDTDFGDFAEFTSMSVIGPGPVPADSLKPQSLTNLDSLLVSVPPQAPIRSPSSNIFYSESNTSKPDESEDMWSLDPGQCPSVIAPPATQFPSLSQPPPFLSSSPPPTPTLTFNVLEKEELNVEEFSLPSEQFGFSEQEIFGIRKQKVKNDQKPKSIQEVLTLSLSKETKKRDSHNTINSIESIDIELKSEENSTKIPNLHPSGDPSVLSSIVDEVVSPSDEYNEVTDPSEVPSPFFEWMLILTEIRSLFDTVLNLLNDILNEDLKEAVISSPQGKAYLEKFTLVFKVYQRIVKSHQSRISQDTWKPHVLMKMNKMLADIDHVWSGVESHCSLYCSLSKLLDVEESVEGEGVCSICLTGGATFLYNSSLYHLGCANYWINCVTDTLPSITG